MTMYFPDFKSRIVYVLVLCREDAGENGFVGKSDIY